jgi:hypothetical protein
LVGVAARRRRRWWVGIDGDVLLHRGGVKRGFIASVGIRCGCVDCGNAAIAACARVVVGRRDVEVTEQ